MNTPPPQAIAVVESVLGVALRGFEPLSGGLTNASWRVTTAAGDELVLRVSQGREQALGIDRGAELAALEAAAAAGLAPRVAWAAPAQGLLLTVALPGAPWTRAQAAEPANLARIGTWFARLHALAPPARLRRRGLRDALADLTLAAARAGNPRLPEPVYQRALRYGDALRATATAFCHNDVHHLNVVDDGDRFAVIDWEYAAVGEAVVDLAEYLAGNRLGPAEAGPLLAAYRAGGHAVADEQLVRAGWLCRLRELLWLDARATGAEAAVWQRSPDRAARIAALLAAD